MNANNKKDGVRPVLDDDPAPSPLRVQTEKNSVRAYVFSFALKLRHGSMQSACLKGAKRRPEQSLSGEAVILGETNLSTPNLCGC